MGADGSRYISGRVDKACLEATEEDISEDAEMPAAPISLVAELVKPYAVYVRNRSS